MVRVKALADGFYPNTLRKKGSEFDVTDAAFAYMEKRKAAGKTVWFERVGPAPAAKKPAPAPAGGGLA